MDMLEKEAFLTRSLDTLGRIWTMLTALPEVRFKDLEPQKTVLIIVDLINGFTKEGALQSPRVAALIPEIVKLSQRCEQLGIVKLAFADSHTEASPEFGAYPVHCLAGTSESDMVDELQTMGGYRLIPKNSTNGFLEEEFQEWLAANSAVDTFVIVGDCTDICIQQLAVTLMTWFNRQNRKSRVIVPINGVDTYDLGLHDAELMNVITFQVMIGNGVEVVKRIV